MANTKVTSNVLADDAVNISNINTVDGNGGGTSPSADGQALVAKNTVGTNDYYLDWASVGVAGISSSANATAITIDSSERVGINQSSPAARLHVFENSAEIARFEGNDEYAYIGLRGTVSGSATSLGYFGFANDTGTAADLNITNAQNGGISFKANSAERMRITSAGNVGISESSPSSLLHIGTVQKGVAGKNLTLAYSPTYYAELTEQSFTAYNNPLIFGTGSGGAERMRIDASGKLLIGTTTSSSTSTETGLILGDGFMTCRSSAQAGIFKRTSSNGIIFIFRNTGDTRVGTIETGSGSTSYNTTSDYRLKENVSYDWDATTRLKQLKPARFNWIEDETNTFVDGFLAHEVSNIVPEAISGEKDAVDEDGNPDYQGIDQSKLVPLLVKTIQELEARIETLESN